jgi:hypothetical protein
MKRISNLLIAAISSQENIFIYYFLEVFEKTRAETALAAGIFHG